MRDGHFGKRGHREHGEHKDRGEHRDREHMSRHGMDSADGGPPKSAQTFRRGRAIAFLDKLMVNRTTLQRQLQEPELDSIKQVICGELKATEAIIEEFIHIFQIHEVTPEEKTVSDTKKEETDQKNENH
ncbi:hypothetical protein D3C76_349480 [compost metagenome]